MFIIKYYQLKTDKKNINKKNWPEGFSPKA